VLGADDRLSGRASLSGTLEVPSNGSPPAPGSRITAITFSSRTGSLARDTVGFRVMSGATHGDVVDEPQIAVSPGLAIPGGNAHRRWR
jgi:hypothetical protein